MIGAIIGDIAGSKYEFAPCNDYDLDLFGPGHDYTDDTICTVAVADAILRGKPYAETVHEWCRRYPNPMGGYGGSFQRWVWSDRPEPYGSYGNGAAMRVSPVAWAFNTREEGLEQAKLTAGITHNHPEGLKGAQTVALAIWLARNGAAKVNMVLDCKDFSGYSLSMRNARNRFDETCQGTVPVALAIIDRSSGFEDAIRRAVSLGADADTLGAIVGSIAEAVWGVPEEMLDAALEYLPDDMQRVLHDFYLKYQHFNRPRTEAEIFLQSCKFFDGTDMSVHMAYKVSEEALWKGRAAAIERLVYNQLANCKDEKDAHRLKSSMDFIDGINKELTGYDLLPLFVSKYYSAFLKGFGRDPGDPSNVERFKNTWLQSYISSTSR